MSNTRILWADDEIDLLKPHILFLNAKGYDIVPVTNGAEAIDYCREENFDIVFLDENMPGISGLEALTEIKNIKPNLPVVMITKSEEEHIMEEAIGSKIADYLIKPVNPNQILMAVKKIMESRRLVSEKTSLGYGKEFGKISMNVMNSFNAAEWTNTYEELVNWDLKLDDSYDQSMPEVLKSQKIEANNQFAKFISNNYLHWLSNPDQETPILSHNLLTKKLFPLLKASKKPVFLVLIDNLRLDQFKTILPILEEDFRMEENDKYFAILPTCTEFARNSLFAGMLPLQIKSRFPGKWFDENVDEGSRNMHEEFFLTENLKRNGLGDLKMSYTKITSINYARQVVDSMHAMFNNDLNVIVYNFVDMLSHARSEMKVLKELAEDETAYRSLTKSWFQNSPLKTMMQMIADKGCQMVLTTDHGSVMVDTPVKIIGDRETTTNLRFKEGKNLNHNDKSIFIINNPEKAQLPKPHISSTYAFTVSGQYFVYPNNYNQYVNMYRDTFQHGGISLEEMIIPFAIFNPK